MGDSPDDGPFVGDENSACQDLFYATSNAECQGGDDGGIRGPDVPMRPPSIGVPAFGILPGENSVNFPVDPLSQTLWDLLGLSASCDLEFGGCGNVGPGFTSTGIRLPRTLFQLAWLFSPDSLLFPTFDTGPPILRRTAGILRLPTAAMRPKAKLTEAQAQDICYRAVQARYNAINPIEGPSGDPGYSIDQGSRVYTRDGGGLLNPNGASNGPGAQGAGGAAALLQGKWADQNTCMEAYRTLP